LSCISLLAVKPVRDERDLDEGIRRLAAALV
jgi:hypothetical protein